MSRSRPNQQRSQHRSRTSRTSRTRTSSASSMHKKPSTSTIVVVLVAVLAVGALVYNSFSSKVDPALAKVVETYPSEGANHIPTGERVTYRTEPPNSGPHYAQWAPPGFYDRPLPDELLVHNLEHGHIIIHYRPDALTDEISGRSSR